MECWKVSLDKDGLKLWSCVVSPLDSTIKEVAVDAIDYDTLAKKDIRIVIEKVTPTFKENGDLEEVICEVSDLVIEEPVDVSRENLDQNIERGERLLVFDNEKIPWDLFNQILEKTADWLVKNGYIRFKDLPVFVPRGKQYLMNTVSQDPKGRPFVVGVKISNSIYLNKNHSRDYCKKHAEYIMRKFAPNVEYEILGFGEPLRGGSEQ